MLESLAAISLIGNIIQFVCFGLDILSRSQEIYHSTTGSLSGNANKETLTEHLIALSTSLQDRSPNSPSADPELGKLCQACKDVSRELLAALNKLKLADATGSPWKSVRKAFRTVWTKDKIESIEQRLKGLREELNLHINAKLR